MRVGEWELDSWVGSGSFAVVWRGRHVRTNTLVAVKEVNTFKLNKKLQESLACEISVLKRTRHQNIVQLLDLIQVRAQV
jgi:serine/threonine protein kinase